MKKSFIKAICVFYEFAIKYRFFIFSLIIALWILSIFTFSKIQLNNSSIVFLPDSSTQLQRMARGMDLAPFSRLLYIDIYHAEGNIENLLQAVQVIKSHIPANLATPVNQNLNIAPVAIMELIPTFFDAKAEKYAKEHIQTAQINKSVQSSLLTLSTFANNLLIPWLRIDPLNLKEIVTKNLPLALNMPTNNMVSDYAISADNKHILLVFQPKFSMHDTDAATKILAHIRKAKLEIPADIAINLNGGLMHTAANSETITNDIDTIILLSFISLALIYIFLVRSWAGIWLLLTPALAISFSLGIMTGISASMSGLALGFGAAILGIAEDYAVHVHFALQKEKNTARVLKFLSIPLFQGFLLNASGFMILFFSAIPAVRQLAAFALLSLFFGFIIALFILPLCPRFYKNSSIAPLEQSLNSYCYAREPVLYRCFALVSILSICCIFMFYSIKIDVSPKSMGVELNSSEMNTKNFMQVWGQNTGELIIVENTNSEILFKDARKLTNMLNANTENSISTLAYFMPSLKEQQDNIARWTNFIGENSAYIKNTIKLECEKLGIEAILFEPFFLIMKQNPILISLDSLRQNEFKNLIDFFVKNNGSKENPLFQTILISTKQINPTLWQNELKTDSALIEQASILSPAALESEIRSVLYAEVKYIPLTFILCIFLLYLCFSNFSKVFLALVSPLCAILCVLVVMYILKSPITLGSIAAFPIVLGLALDHGIIVTHDLEHRTNFGIRKALVVSSLTTCMGMGLLAFANHPTLRAMGQVIFIGLLVEIIVSLYILPLLCKKRASNEV